MHGHMYVFHPLKDVTVIRLSKYSMYVYIYILTMMGLQNITSQITIYYGQANPKSRYENYIFSIFFEMKI